METPLPEQRLLSMCEVSVHQELQLRRARELTLEALCEAVSSSTRSSLTRKDMKALLDHERTITESVATTGGCVKWFTR